ncbi:helix-turn-helix transcriptional regulator [Amycolatopsis rubida]|uniref:Helix-turn-helix transcriptional regulator n=1 Tax=Amycolatopsis rubida TaxID=112413 RepID=A0ABX0BHJ7_9PSEU|nr:helix-turn-helix transcriptional regulator [Amycolatopsis rubida]MYW89166.1 helix-turn-helix domain-containing protein [Amycolatopsis rubida]NEC54144.1 helix-turn-helix transcriptional regulator [Amycolatopsis rubida]
MTEPLVTSPIRQPPPSLRTQRSRLGSRILTWRTARGLTQVDLADGIGCKQPKIQKIESGKAGTRPDDLERIIEVLDIPPADADQLRELNQANDPSARRAERRMITPQWFREILEREQAAAEILSWTGNRIPGLLQSEYYMLAQFQASRQERVTDRVAERKARQRLFDAFPAPRAVFMLEYSCIEKLVCGTKASIATDQLEHMIRIVETHPFAEVRILPRDAAAYPDEDFTILRFDHPDLPDFAYQESKVKLITVPRGQDEFASYEESWEAQLAATLSRDQSLQYLKEWASRCATPAR